MLNNNQFEISSKDHVWDMMGGVDEGILELIWWAVGVCETKKTGNRSTYSVYTTLHSTEKQPHHQPLQDTTLQTLSSSGREGVWTPGSWSHDAKCKSHHLACYNVCEPCYIGNLREVTCDTGSLSGSGCSSASAAAVPEVSCVHRMKCMSSC